MDFLDKCIAVQCSAVHVTAAIDGQGVLWWPMWHVAAAIGGPVVLWCCEKWGSPGKSKLACSLMQNVIIENTFFLYFWGNLIV